MGELRAADAVVVAEQIGRKPTTPFSVVVRCVGGHPLVIRNRPFDAEGDPFPTLYWLTCPDAVRAVSRLESTGRIAELNALAETDPGFADRLRVAHEEYARERARDDPGSEAFGGVGGTREGIKCLHAHYANHLAGGDDPVGEIVAAEIVPPHGPHPPGRVAAVDQGTNSIRLLVLEADGAELARDMVITRLGEGVDRDGRIAPEALRRTVEVLWRYVRRARALGVGRLRVGATSAVRDAANRSEYEAAVSSVAGVAPEILDGTYEASLSFRGAVEGLEAPGPFLVIDIGGGSTEFALGSKVPEQTVSTQMGSVRLTERHLHADPPDPVQMNQLRRDVDDVLAEVERNVDVGSARTLVAVAGTATTVRAVALRLDRHDPDLVHHSILTIGEARDVLERLSRMDNAQRRAIPVMAPGRAEVIVAGAAVLVEALQRWGFDQVVVSEHDILDGLATELLGRG